MPLKDVITYAFAKGLPGLIGLASVLILLRVVGAENYGRYALLFSIVTVISTAAGAWFYQSLLRYGVAWVEKGWEFAATKKWGVAIAGALFVSVYSIYLLVDDNANWSKSEIWAALFLGALMILQATKQSEAQATLKARRFLHAELIRSAVGFLAAMGLSLKFRDDGSAILWGIAIGYLASIVLIRTQFTGAVSTSQISVSSFQSIRSRLAIAWRYGWPLSFWISGQLMLPLIDRSMILAHSGPELMGNFSGLSDIITRSFSFLLFPITQGVYPHLTKLVHANELSAAQKLLRKALLTLAGLGTLSVGAIVCFEQEITSLVIPHQSADYLGLVLPLALSGVAWQTALLLHKPMELRNQTRSMLVFMAIAVLSKALMTQRGLRSFGLEAAAWSSFLAALVYCGLCAINIFAYQRSRLKK